MHGTVFRDVVPPNACPDLRKSLEKPEHGGQIYQYKSGISVAWLH